MLIALQHDELKPLTKTFTDSLSELGNLNVSDFYLRIFVSLLHMGGVTVFLPHFQLEHLPQDYSGSALTLIESLSRYNIYLERQVCSELSCSTYQWRVCVCCTLLYYAVFIWSLNGIILYHFSDMKTFSLSLSLPQKSSYIR